MKLNKAQLDADSIWNELSKNDKNGDWFHKFNTKFSILIDKLSLNIISKKYD